MLTVSACATPAAAQARRHAPTRIALPKTIFLLLIVELRRTPSLGALLSGMIFLQAGGAIVHLD
ncbi:MAG: hypothetical protein AMXMBFR31_28230 [Candidatus Desulfobacillus denitrificans]|nr:MAG: hypothetical protein BroJett012_09900 [Betaproteobacteria bacterium]GJQ55741.1 MAG: hypothetical protein HKUEN07_23100 [Rhodocyclaceae bacterium]